MNDIALDEAILRPLIDSNFFPGSDPANLGTMFGALAKAQGEFEAIVKNREANIRPKDLTKTAFKFKYADMEEVTAKTRPALSKNGYALLAIVSTGPDGGATLRTVLAHSCGGWIESTVKLPRGRDTEIKDFGAAITYLRRYVACALLGIAADDDLDEDETPSGEGHHLAPNHALTHPLMKEAKSIGELARIMSGLSKEDKVKYYAYHNARMDELERENKDAQQGAA